jgi:nitroimidazol reductase NimA-like FMN-containing flavoprotein (pyridoxamine 5'-phosphate oxidase superfamily)
MPTERTKVKRVPKRGHYEREVIYDILDAHFLCHVAFVHEDYPVVIPTLYGRWEDHLFLHGATSSRMIQALGQGINMSICVTHVDGFVLARSAFHHSMNYRSVVLFGQGRLVPEDEKYGALKVISEHIVPGRWEEVREPDERELKATHVIAIPIHEMSAKIRTGPPADDQPDYDLNVWAGEVPLRLVAGDPVTDPGSQREVSVSGVIERLLLKYR